MTAVVASVNTGRVREEPLPGRVRRTAIRKLPAAGPLAVGPLGLAGDEVGDTRDHGGPVQAVYAFAREDLDVWSARLGAPIPPGTFGENLTTSGIDVNEALVGERWRVGTALLEISSVRIPCSTFAGWLAAQGYDDTRWVRRFTAEARPGPYLRVLEPGVVAAGDPVQVVHRPDHGVTVSLMFRALTTEPHLKPLLGGLDRPEAPAGQDGRGRPGPGGTDRMPQKATQR